MTFRLFSSMFRLLLPPRASRKDRQLLQAIELNTSVTSEVVEKSRRIDRALDNIEEAGRGLFT